MILPEAISAIALLPSNSPLPVIGSPIALESSAVSRALPSRCELSANPPAFVVSDDGDAMFMPFFYGQSDAVALPSFARIAYSHASTYYVTLYRNPLRSAAYTPGQRSGQLIKSASQELHTAHETGTLLAARSRYAWIDARTVCYDRSGGDIYYLVISKIARSETPESRNVSALTPCVDKYAAIAAAYGPSGEPVAGVEIRNYGARAGYYGLKFEQYALTTSGAVRAWHRNHWHRFWIHLGDTDSFQATANDVAAACDPISGRAAVVDRNDLLEWNPTNRAVVRRRLPGNAKVEKLYYFNHRLLVLTVARDKYNSLVSHPNRARDAWREAASSQRLYAVEGAKWTFLGPFCVYGWSENGRFVVLRDVTVDKWWRFDSSQAPP